LRKFSWKVCNVVGTIFASDWLIEPLYGKMAGNPSSGGTVAKERPAKAQARWAAVTKPPYKQIGPGIMQAVRVLHESGVETFESCEGGDGHAFYDPTIRFHGGHEEGFRALAVALQHGLHVSELRRYYSIQNGFPVGPYWEMTFLPQ
jgi:hypothetical protein